MLLAAFTALDTGLQMVRTHNVIPQADEWFSLSLYERWVHHGYALSLMLKPHNEHRLLFPRIVFFSDYLLFGGCGLLDKGVIYLTQASEAALFAWFASRVGAGAAARAALGAVATVLMFSLQQSENFVWAFQVQFVGVFASASLCCTLFAHGVVASPGSRAARRMLVGAFGLVAVATFTMANGLLVGPVLVVLALLARAGRAVVLAAAVVAVAATAAFFAGYAPVTDRETAAQLIAHAGRVLAFTAGYLGNLSPFGDASQVALGACGLAAMTGIVVEAAWRGERDAVRLSLCGIALFSAGSALVTAVGRSSFGMNGIGASRYSTGAAVFWAAVIFGAWAVSRTGPAGSMGRGMACLAAAIPLGATMAGQATFGAEMERRAVQYDAIEDAMLLGLYDVPALKDLEEPVDHVRAMEPILRDLHLSVFRSREARALGRVLTDVRGPGSPPLACDGGFAAAIAVPALGPDGVMVSGVSSLGSRLGRPGRVYIVGDDGRVVGFAHTGFGDRRWSGYARSRAGAGLSAWALSDAGRSCRLGSTTVSPADG